MKLFRAAFNGIGSGAGVTWPLFGIAFTLLGGSIGGVLSLTLGTFCIGLFIVLGFSICYFAYQDMANKELQFQQQLQKNQDKLLKDIENYIANIQLQCTHDSTNFDEYFQKRLKEDLEKTGTNINSPLYQILVVMQAAYEKQGAIPGDKEIIGQITEMAAQQPVPFLNMFIPAFLGFVGIFGSIAGCSAGFTGLLNGIGLFSSFAAFPVLGWGVLGTAFVLGLFCAIKSVLEEQENFKMGTLNQTFKNMHHELSKVTANKGLFQTLITLAVSKEQGELLLPEEPLCSPPLFRQSQHLTAESEVKDIQNDMQYTQYV